jgi:hypothetical protein
LAAYDATEGKRVGKQLEEMILVAAALAMPGGDDTRIAPASIPAGVVAADRFSVGLLVRT